MGVFRKQIQVVRVAMAEVTGCQRRPAGQEEVPTERGLGNLGKQLPLKWAEDFDGLGVGFCQTEIEFPEPANRSRKHKGW